MCVSFESLGAVGSSSPWIVCFFRELVRIFRPSWWLHPRLKICMSLKKHTIRILLDPMACKLSKETHIYNGLIQRLLSSQKKHTIRVLVPDWLPGRSHSDMRVYIREAREYTLLTSIIVVQGSDLNYICTWSNMRRHWFVIWGGQLLRWRIIASHITGTSIGMWAEDQNHWHLRGSTSQMKMAEGLGRIQAAWRVSDDLQSLTLVCKVADHQRGLLAVWIEGRFAVWQVKSCARRRSGRGSAYIFFFIALHLHDWTKHWHTHTHTWLKLTHTHIHHWN